jgi:hypothetical protein
MRITKTFLYIDLGSAIVADAVAAENPRWFLDTRFLRNLHYYEHLSGNWLTSTRKNFNTT